MGVQDGARIERHWVESGADAAGPRGGFDPRWTSPAHFINGITREIWEERNIHSLRRYYGPTMVVRSPASIVVGNDGVIAATMATLAEFPDRRLLGEDVIWCRTDAEADWDEEAGDAVEAEMAGERPRRAETAARNGGPARKDGSGHETPREASRGWARGSFLSSHRLVCTMTHARPGVYGEPTGKRLRYRILADCAARDNALYDEWLVRDQGAIVRQIGWCPRDYAAHLIEREGGPEACVRPFHPSLDRGAQYTGRGNDNPVGRRHAELLGRIMDGEMSAIKRGYDRAAHLELPGFVTEYGRAAADEFWMGLRSALPDAAFTIEHVIGREDLGHAPRSAVRWSLTGRHSGWGAFGAPSGAELHVMGLSHAEWGPDGLRREWTLFDETAIYKQIRLATG